MGVPRFGPEVETNFRAVPSFRPSAPDAAMNLMAGLGNVMDGIVGQVQKIQAAHVEAEATAAGAAAGSRAGFDPYELERQEWTIAGQAYQQAAAKSFAANLELGRDEAFNRFQLEYEATPEQERNPMVLRGRIQQWVDGTAASLPESMRPGFTQLALSKANPLVLSATKSFVAAAQQRAKAENEAVLSLLEEEILRNPLPESQADFESTAIAMVQYRETMNALGMSEPEQRLKLREIGVKQRDASILAEFEAAPDKVNYIAAFTGVDPATMGLDTEEQNRLANLMQAKVADAEWVEKQRAVELTHLQRTELELQKNDIEDRVSSGDITQQELVAFGQANQDNVAPDWLANQMTQLNKVLAGIDETNADIDALLRGELLVNPNSADAQKLVDAAYGRLVGGVVSPVGNASVSSPFGKRKAPKAGASTFHRGTDYDVPVGTEVRAPLSGWVVKVGSGGNAGNLVEVRLDNGDIVKSFHNQSSSVKVGQRVQPGQVIALSGATGNVTGPHAHIEVWRNGQPVDPQKYFKRPNVTPEKADQAVKRLMLTTGMIPKAVRDQLVGGLHSKDLKNQLSAVEQIGWLIDRDIELQGFTERDEAFATRVWMDVRRNIDPEVALETAKFETDPLNQNFVDGTQKWIKDHKVLEKAENRVERFFESGGFLGVGKTSPVIPVADGTLDNAQADYNRLLSLALMQTGRNEEAARKIASQRIRKLYNYTQVDGALRLMKYPPESYYKVYGPDRDDDWMRKQLYTEVKAATGKTYAPGKVFLVADLQTAKEVERNGKPSYKVGVLNEWGQLEFPSALDRWEPNTEPYIQAERKARQGKRERELAAMRAKRDDAKAKQAKAKAQAQAVMPGASSAERIFGPSAETQSKRKQNRAKVDFDPVVEGMLNPPSLISRHANQLMQTERQQYEALKRRGSASLSISERARYVRLKRQYEKD